MRLQNYKKDCRQTIEPKPETGKNDFF